MAKRKLRPHCDKRRAPVTAPWPVTLGLTDAKTLLAQYRYAEAIGLLEDLDERYPDRVDVSIALANVYLEAQDRTNYLVVSARLRDLLPDDPDAAQSLAKA